METKFSYRRNPKSAEHNAPGSYQSGNLTIFTALFALVLMTLMQVYSTRVGLFEQRVSANETSQKIAFHMAESAIDQGIEYMLANSGRIFSDSTTEIQFGENSFRPGWFANDGTNPGWAPCTDALIVKTNHPCGSDGNPSIPMTNTSFFYDDPTTTAGTSVGADSLPINLAAIQANATARLTAVLCIVDAADPSGACKGAPADESEAQDALAVVYMMGYGFSDCEDVTDVSTCKGEARIARPVSTFKGIQGGPGVPFVSRSAFPAQGTFEIAGNPNGGGLGVPLTTWLHENPNCAAQGEPAAPDPAVTSSGTWQTCELGDWYQTASLPEGTTCTLQTGCRCGPGGNDPAYFLSYRAMSDTNIGIDIIQDPTFPCDLFEYYFGPEDDFYYIVKNQATVINDCSGLNQYSSGLYWATGSSCVINANTQVGSPDNPIILISAASLTRINGGASIYGLLYVFDGEDANAEVELLGGTTVYGSAVIDATISKTQGTNSVVWAQGVMADASGINGIGSVSGGWRDFGLPAWE